MSRNIVTALTGRTIRCILFDLGSTLWTDKVGFDKLTQQHTGQQRALSILHQHVAPHFFPSMDDSALSELIVQTIKQRIYDMYMSDTKLEPDFAMGVVEALQQIGFPRIERRVGLEIFEALRTRSFDSRALFDDALTTLAALQQRGFLLGVVTNREYGGPLFIEDMQNFGLLDYFEEQHIAISADLHVRKPNPVIFQHALQALNIPSEEAVMVGDSLGADVVGAKGLGIFAIWKPTPRLFEKARAKALEHAVQASSFEEYVLKDVFRRARKREEKKGRPIPADLQPDLVIEHLGELLDVFVEVGKQ